MLAGPSVEASPLPQRHLHLAQVQEGASANSAQSEAGQPGDARPSAPERSLDDKLAGFVTDFYLSGEARSRGDLEELYAPTVDYFDSGRLERERVLRDKQAYFTKWPRRQYRLIRESLKSQWRPGPGKVLDVTFEYDFDVASSIRRSRGRGRAALTLDLTLDGGRITREQGAVLQRW